AFKSVILIRYLTGMSDVRGIMPRVSRVLPHLSVEEVQQKIKNGRSLVIKEVNGSKVLSRQQLEICLFSYLATEFKTGDACVVGSESYADFREQLLSLTECEPLLEDYCRQLNFPDNGAEFVEYLREQLTKVANEVDTLSADGKQ
ncbi:MAG: hypothetical protein WBM86_02245, partial [Waterburya sp.]